MGSAVRKVALLFVAFAAGAALTIGVPPAATAATPTVLTVGTVPALPGALLVIDGVRFTTDAQGGAVVHVPDVAEGLPLLTVRDDGISASNREARFSRWADVSEAGEGMSANAVFDVYELITWSYVEVDGAPVDPDTVSELIVRSSHGNVHTFTRREPVWLHALRVVPSVGGLVEKEIEYRIVSAKIDGAETVIRSQQSFIPARQRSWEIELLFYQAKFSARDAALGWPITAGIQVEYPSGKVTHHQLDARGELELRLPRGTYRALVEGPGMAVWTPVALSRDQQIQITVLSYLDIGLGLGIVACLAVGLLVVGRPHLVPRVGRAVVARVGTSAGAGPRLAAAYRTEARPPCFGRCPPAAPTARYCRLCGAPRNTERAGPGIGINVRPDGASGERAGQHHG